MEKQEIRSLVVELRDRIESEKLYGSREKDIIVGGSYERLRRKLSRPLKIKKEEMDQLIALRKFLIANPYVTQEDLNALLCGELMKFKFLRKVNKMLPDFAEELRDYGAQVVACYYANRIRAVKEIDRALP